MLRNNNYFNTSNNPKNKIDDLNKIKYDISTTSNIINEYKKLSKRKFLNSDVQLNKINSIYNRNKTISKEKESLTSGFFPNNKKFKKKLRANIYNNYLKKINEDDNIQPNDQRNIQAKTNNNFYNDDTDHSSMETIKKILYSTDSKKEVNKDSINNLIKSSQINNIPNLNDIFNNYKIIKEKDGNISPLTLHKNNTNNNNINNYRYKKNLKQDNDNKTIDKNLLNQINKKLSIKAKKVALKSMNFLKTNNNYDYDFENNNSINISDEFKDIIEEKEINKHKNNNIYNNNNNNNYTVRKIHNNINININNNKADNNNLESNNNYTTRYNNIDIDSNFLNFSDENEHNNNNNEKNDDIFYLKEKIKELTEEINNKNILINEYPNLAKKSKIKFEQLIIHNKKNMEQMQKENKKQSMLYKSKINNIEKEKQNILNKYMENKQYTEFLENLLFNQNNSEKSDNNNNDENKKIKNLEKIIKKLMSEISVIKLELETKNKDNEKLKNIIIKYKENKNYRAISNPRKNINIIEKLIEARSTSKNNNKMKIKELSSNIEPKTKKYYNKTINPNIKEIENK